MAISTPDFDFVRDLARNGAAIVLEPDKQYLVETRLTPLAEREGYGSLEALIRALRAASAPGDLHDKTVDALTTNETLFFRDYHPFEALRTQVLPRLIEARSKSRELRIWCGACSTGQEPYSIAMLIREHFPVLAGWRVSIMATDISETVLGIARAGTYAQHEVNRGLPAPLLIKYFRQSGNQWVIGDDIKSMVTFRSLNLIRPWPPLPSFDLIFLRNVLIYFSVETKTKILLGLMGKLADPGYLALGSAETALLLVPALKAETIGKATYYTRKAIP
jgi:chemotaxis protein methyltransferase CheR